MVRRGGMMKMLMVYKSDIEGYTVPRGKNQWMCIRRDCTERKQVIAVMMRLMRMRMMTTIK